MKRGQKVIEIATGRTATVINAWPMGTESHSEPWAKIMFGLGTGGVAFCCRDLTELRLEGEAPAIYLAPSPLAAQAKQGGLSMINRTLASAQLSDGAVYIERMGRTYLVTRTYSEWLRAPDGAHGLTLPAAQAIFSDFIAADLLEQGN